MTKQLTNRAKQALATRDKIYKTGIKILRNKGFDHVHVQQIAKEAGVSVGTFYHHFESKLDLFMELYRRADRYFEEDLPLKLKGKNTAQKIMLFFSEYTSLPVQDGLPLSQKLYIPDNKLFLTQPRAMHELLLSIITEGQRTGEITDEISAEELRDTLFTVARGVIFDWALQDGSYDPYHKMGLMISHFIKLYTI